MNLTPHCHSLTNRDKPDFLFSLHMSKSELHVPNSVRSMVNRLCIEHGSPSGQPGPLFQVIMPDIVYRASLFFSIRPYPNSIRETVFDVG
jgi:hypothetical protein